MAEAMTGPTPGRYRHFKGNEYDVLGVGAHSETGEPLVLYRARYGTLALYARPLANFLGTVVVGTDHEPVPRFVRAEGATADPAGPVERVMGLVSDLVRAEVERAEMFAVSSALAEPYEQEAEQVRARLRGEVAAIVGAAQEVRESFHAVSADRNGLVRWEVSASAVKRLILALHGYDPAPAPPAGGSGEVVAAPSGREEGADG